MQNVIFLLVHLQFLIIIEPIAVHTRTGKFALYMICAIISRFYLHKEALCK